MTNAEVEPPSGRQLEIQHADQRAVIVEVGGGLREYVVGGKAILDGYAVDETADGGRGQPLLPWPNRLADGRYEFDGRTLQVPIDEVARNNASHGLTRWLNWTMEAHSTDRVRMGLLLHPRPGYPFTLRLSIDYSLDAHGLTVRTSAKNEGASPLPFGAGQHPYFSLGTRRVDDLSLRVPAANWLEMQPQRLVPTGRVLGVDGSQVDFRSSRTIGDAVLDVCFADLSHDPDGRTSIALVNPATHDSLSVWLAEPYRYVQVFTGDTLAAERRRQGLAIEPMTCPPNAFQSHVDLIVLQPGESVQLAWGAALTVC